MIRIIALILLLISTFAFGTPLEKVDAEDPVFGRPVMLTNTASVQSPEIAVSGSNVYVVWEGGRDQGGNAEAEIYFRASNDNGETFGPIINLSNIFGFSMGPKIAVSGSNVYVGWTESVAIDRGEEYGQQRFIWEPYEVFFTVSNDNGTTFGPVVNLSNSKTTESYIVGIAVSGNNVYVLSVETGVGILFMVSNNSGATFSTPITLDVGYNPRMAASGSNVYVLGTAGLIVSNNNGATFGPIIKMGPYYYASIAASGASVYVAYWDENNLGTNPEIFFRASNDNGVTFGNTINLSNNQRDSTSAAIAASDNSVYVVWQDSSPQNPGPYDGNYRNHDILFRASNDNGVTFNDTLIPSNGVGHSVAPKIAMSGSYLHVIWVTKVSPDWYFDISYTRSPPTENSLVPIPPSDPSPPSPPPPSPSPSPDPSSTQSVDIDVKPASTSNTVNCATQKGGIPVGIYTEDGFDAQSVDISTLELLDAPAQKYVLKDLDGDGDLDGVARFKKADLCESGEILSLSSSINVKLSGLTDDGAQFEGTDIIRFKR